MADEKIIFSMVGVSKTFTNQKKVLNNIYLSFFYGAKIGIIGLNGSGKSTLMKIIAGIDKNFQGEVVFSPGYTVGYLEQEPKLDDAKTVREVVEEGCASTVALLKEYEEINQKLCEPMDDEEMARLIERQGELYEQIDHVNGWELDSVLERAMDALRCPDPDQSVKVLSGGERRRVALCRLLLQQPDVLLLDEPTNHLDAESIDWLEQHLQQYKGTVIAVTHDRYFLDNVAGWILELDRGEGIPWKGNYSGWLEQKTTRMAMEEKQESKRRKTLERELELLEKYLDIQSLRFEDRFAWEIDVDERFQHCIVPKLILQPLVENSIIHGVANMDDGYIKLSAREESGTLILSVQDNGVGIPQDVLDWLNDPDRDVPGGHLGLKNVDRIVRLYYGGDYGISAYSAAGEGSRVELRLPMNKEGNGNAEGSGR